MKRRLAPWLAIALVLVLALSALAAPTTVVLAVDGMTWGTWPIVVKRALEGLKGVSRADVSFADKQARVVFDPALVTVDQMIAALKRVGFQASLKP